MTYLMESPEEGARVERKTNLPLLRAQLAWAGVTPGQRVLDLGCAAGVCCREIAEVVGPTGWTVGVDQSMDRLEAARATGCACGRVEYRHGPACSIPAADGEFDLSWSRFLFEYLDEPDRALAEMVRVTRSGGTVVVSDLDGNCIWHSGIRPALASEIDAALAALGGSFDPRAGLGLFPRFVDAGLRDIRVDLRPYHVICGAIGAREGEHWDAKLRGVAGALRQRGWSAARAASLIAMMREHLDDRRTMTYSVLVSVAGVVP